MEDFERIPIKATRTALIESGGTKLKCEVFVSYADELIISLSRIILIRYDKRRQSYDGPLAENKSLRDIAFRMSKDYAERERE